MDLSVHKICLMVMLVECFVGVILNIFMVAFQFMRSKKLKSQRTYNKILTCMAICRSCLLCHMSVFYILILFFPWVFINITLRVFFMVKVMMLHYTNLWITTFLFVFYCVKITNYNHKLFIFMKTRISRLVHHFIVACFLVSLASSLPFGWCVVYLPEQTSANVSMKNLTTLNVLYKENVRNKLMLFLAGSFPPFILSCVAIYLLVRSLWSHVREMTSEEKGFRSPNIEAHINAVKSMAVFLLCNVLYFVCMSVLFSDVINDSNPYKMINSVIIFALPSVHSAFLVTSSFKLKEALTEWCHCGIRCFKV